MQEITLKNRISRQRMKLRNFKMGYIEKNPNFFDKLKNEFNEQALVESGLVLFG